MIRVGAAILVTLTVVALVVAVVLLGQEQERQSRQLSRLSECISTLERNQAVPHGQVIAGCPIYN